MEKEQAEEIIHAMGRMSALDATLVGQMLAALVTQDALISTVLTGQPQLANKMAEEIQTYYDTVDGSMSGPTLEAFQGRLNQVRELVATLSSASPK